MLWAKPTYLIVLFGIASITAGCASAVEPNAPPANPPEGLTITTEEPDSIRGSYVEQGNGFQFASDRSANGAHLVFRSLDGTDLIDVLDDAATKSETLTYFGGRLRQTISHALTDAKTLSSPPSADDFLSIGDATAATELAARPEYRLLPGLSNALGGLGLDGKSHPATLPIHLIALRAGQVAATARRQIPLDPLIHPEAIQPNGPCVPFTCANGLTICFGATSCISEPIAICPTDFGGDLQTDPCNNDCYGMCGPDCTCWTQVCGDCSYHQGCATHDDWCGGCSILAPWNCALCYSPTAIYAVLDCRL
jgi:hypothetical protein